MASESIAHSAFGLRPHGLLTLSPFRLEELNNRLVPRQQDVWFYFLCSVSTVGQIMLWHLLKKCIESRASKLFIKWCIWLNLYAKVVFFLSAYITLLWLPGAQQQNKLKQFLVFANVGVLFSLEILPQACEKHIQLDFLSSNFNFGVLHSQKCCHVSVHIWLDRARDPISVALFNQVALISEFNHLFELLGPGFTSYSSNPLYILEWSSRNILKTLITNFTNNFLVRNACCSYKAVK